MDTLRQVGRNYAGLYGYVLRLPAARIVLFGLILLAAGGSVPLPIPGFALWTVCRDLRTNPPLISDERQL